jgi:hypothetical protein
MPSDPLVREVRRVRVALATRFNNDPDAIIRDLMARQREISVGHVMLQDAREPLETASKTQIE